MKEFSIFITLLSDINIDKILSFLVKEGYAVSSLADNPNLLCIKNTSANLFALRAKIDKKDTTHSTLMTSLSAFLKEKDIKYFSMVVMDFASKITWNVGNIDLTQIVKEKPKPKNNLSNLRLLDNKDMIHDENENKKL